MPTLWMVAVGVLMVNLPFGFWRAGLRKLTLPWFLAVHAPIPLVVGLRILSGLGWHLSTFPVMASAFFAGQFLGGGARLWWTRRQPALALRSAPGDGTSPEGPTP